MQFSDLSKIPFGNSFKIHHFSLDFSIISSRIIFFINSKSNAKNDILRLSDLRLSRFIAYNVLHPDALFHQNKSDHALDQIGKLYTDKDGNYRERRIVAQTVGDRDAHQTDKGAVKQEGDDRLAAGTQGKVCGVQKGILRHKARANHDEVPGKKPGVIRGVVEHREQRRSQEHGNSDAGTAQYGEGDHLPVGVLRLVHLAGAEKLTDNDRHGVAQRDKDDVKHVVNGVRDILCSHDIQSAHGVALCKDRHAGGPQGFVHQKRRSLNKDLGQKSARHF